MTTIEPQTWTPPLFSHHSMNKRVAETDPIVTDDSHIVRTIRSD